MQEFPSLTVSEFNGLVKEVLNMGFPQAIWLCGEIQGYNRNKDRKHVFFELCEKDEESQDIVARIGLVIFAGKKSYIEDILRRVPNSFELKDDIEVKFLCRVDFYPPHGAIRLIVENIDPVYTLGRIAQEKRKLIARLKEMGVLEKNKALELNPLPLRIGLITAYDSAAYNDFISELKLSGYGFRVYYHRSVMQGRNVEKEICHALDKLSEIKDLDAVVITRGGGSAADLSCFDSEQIAVEISQLKIPLLSGIGHEIDLSVTDLAAHSYRKTPTAVARFLVGRIEESLTDLEEQGRRIAASARERLGEDKKHLKHSAFQLQSATHYFLKQHHEKLYGYAAVVRQQPPRLLKDYQRQIETFGESLRKIVRKRFKSEKTKIDHCARLIDMAHPQKILKRGFSITRTEERKLIRRAEGVRDDEILITQLSEGEVRSKVHK